MPSGNRTPKKRTPVAEKQQETGTISGLPPGRVSHNWPDTGPGARTRKGADVRRVSL